ncbi:hypothetical protein HELRODRAFT_158650 [Helobdella robusta]|uniref:DUF4371 domain-containing protein n=1 Tax=Helobdella robusta TaxID=6412 RepID=T1EN31_HELRO|nr:hypothetical protein HELRODRAFT_158650 [Helobdella robusta]ESO12187.1 hypothetical protein HELRODRAFT_158650 [Helobdella robusta]
MKSYLENVLRRAIGVNCTIAERGLAFRGANEKFGSLLNGNYLGLLELRWKILKGCLGNETPVKSLSDTRWKAHAVATEAILRSYSQIIEALECIQGIQKDHLQKGDTRREAENIVKEMQKLELVSVLTLIVDGNAPEVSLNARDKFCTFAFHIIVDKLETELSK